MIIPSVDLSDGKAVQLKQGREKALERENPVEVAQSFNKYGEIAVIDLDAAMGKGDNEKVIRQICNVADCRVGGGVRDAEKAARLVTYGAHKIIIGTRAFTDDGIDHAFLKEITEAIGAQRLIIAIDAFNGEIVTKGWKHHTGMQVLDVIGELDQYASEFLFTTVEKEGMMQGTDLDLVQKVTGKTKRPVVVAGGVTTVDEIKAISKLNAHIQLGMAVYTGALSLADAFIASLDWDKGLIPTVTVDRTSQVLMLAYSNQESVKKIFETGKGWYFSRSREKLWMKGESSGNVQDFVKIRTDCDRDTLLLTVAQQGVACHTGNYSCFGDKQFSLQELFGVIQERFANPTPGSYTASLTEELVHEKIMEEAQEVIEARTEDEIVWEAADVLYFTLALLAKKQVPLDFVVNELRRRRRKSK